MQRKSSSEYREGSFLSFGGKLIEWLIVGTIVIAVLITWVSPFV